ncbi:unnamed protein product [Enterobius vermicularis]|uniref:Uncharacterized protein n=1 Tax=Enterobius vermicularis TaxID=51028 RepID=A0A0N4VPV0_ENTVE|nr:unnamed protein product [Enterobius vermicularis]
MIEKKITVAFNNEIQMKTTTTVGDDDNDVDSVLNVAERIDDIRRLSASRRDALQKMASKESRKPPVQVVSPEKLQRNVSTISVTSVAKLSPTKIFSMINA